MSGRCTQLAGWECLGDRRGDRRGEGAIAGRRWSGGEQQFLCDLAHRVGRCRPSAGIVSGVGIRACGLSLIEGLAPYRGLLGWREALCVDVLPPELRAGRLARVECLLSEVRSPIERRVLTERLRASLVPWLLRQCHGWFVVLHTRWCLGNSWRALLMPSCVPRSARSHELPLAPALARPPVRSLVPLPVCLLACSLFARWLIFGASSVAIADSIGKRLIVVETQAPALEESISSVAERHAAQPNPHRGELPHLVTTENYRIRKSM